MAMLFPILCHIIVCRDFGYVGFLQDIMLYSHVHDSSDFAHSTLEAFIGHMWVGDNLHEDAKVSHISKYLGVQ